MLILFNKPFGVICQFRASGDTPTLADYIARSGVYPAGRLDKDSEGLVLLTDDGKLQQRIANPRHKLPKTYWVQVEGIPKGDALKALAKGVTLKDGPTRPAEVEAIEPPPLWPRQPPVRYRKHIPTAWLSMTLYEGRNRQVRRMTATVGYPTLRLIRVRIGPWVLGDLEPGQWLELSHNKALRQIEALNG